MLLIPTLLCPKSWESMSGDETRRFCTYCKKHVHNLAALSSNERLALLSSPAASICSRYRVAIRRPVKGMEAPYLQHLVKYGAGVALTGSVLLVLWEMHGQTEQQKYYRTGTGANCAMPKNLYTEHRSQLLGEMYVRPRPAPKSEPANPETVSTPTHLDLHLDSAVIDALIDNTQPLISVPKPELPLEIKQAKGRRPAGLRSSRT